MTNVYEIVTERILRDLENGVIPWRKGWTLNKIPRNYVTGKAYRGINLLLLSPEYASQYWLSYRQAKAAGGHVRKGEHGSMVVFYKPVYEEITDPVTGEKSQRQSGMILRYYTVFNLSQCDGVKPRKDEESPEDSQTLPEPAAFHTAILQNAGIPVKYGNPAYRPKDDVLLMPAPGDFTGPAEYHAALSHELVHWTGHPSRIGRPGVVSVLEGKSRFGSEVYSQEELVAEIGASFLSALLGIEEETRENSTAYIKGWLTALRGDSRVIVRAAGQAQTAADLLRAIAAGGNAGAA